MAEDKNVVLISTLHDPEGRMVPFIPSCLPFLTQLYQFLVVIATPTTSAQTFAALVDPNVGLFTDGNRNIGENRRRALSRALQQESALFFHYCDFDRLLHWTLNHRRELETVVQDEVPCADYTALGRTPTAFDSHPPVQRELEAMTNEVFSFAFGQQMDVTAGSCGLSRRAGEFLVRHSVEMNNATDTEWPMLIGRQAGLSVNYRAVHGLEFETATFYGDEIYTLAHTAENWAKRAHLARTSIQAVLRLNNGHKRPDATYNM